MRKLSNRQINQLLYGKTCNGRLGCEIKNSLDIEENKSWISIVKKIMEGERYFELEYVQLNSDYCEDVHGYDYDMFLNKREFFRFDSIDSLEIGLCKWVENFAELKPIASINHPIW